MADNIPWYDTGGNETDFNPITGRREPEPPEPPQPPEPSGDPAVDELGNVILDDLNDNRNQWAPK